MPRVKGGFTTGRRHGKWIKRAKGFQSVSNNVYKKVRERVEYALNQSFSGRKVKKRDFRRLWNIRINAAARLHGLSYSVLIGKLHKCDIALNRKVLSDVAVRYPDSFKAICEFINSQ